MKLIKSYIIVLLFVMALILSSIAMLMYSTPVQEQILRQVVQKINQSLPAQISFKSLEGNLFKHFIIRGLNISHDNKSILSAQSIGVNYQFSALLKQKLHIHSINIDTLNVDFEIFNDQSNTFSRAFSSTQKEAKKNKSTLPEIILNDIQVKDSKLNFTYHQKQISKKLESFHLKSQLSIHQNTVRYDQKVLAFVMDKTPFQSNDLHLKISEDMILLNANENQINQSRFLVYSQISDSLKIKKIYLEASKFELYDLNIINNDLAFDPHTYQVQALVEQNPQHTVADVLIQDKKGKASVQISISEKEKMNLNAILTLSKFTLSNFLNQSIKGQTGITDLYADGQIKANIQGDQLKDNDISLNLNLNQVRINHLIFSDNTINLKKKGNDAILEAELNYKESHALLNAQCYELFTTEQKINPDVSFKGDLVTKHIKLNDFGLTEPMASLNIQQTISQFEGKGIDIVNGDFNLTSHIHEILFEDTKVDSINFDIRKKKSDLEIKSFELGMNEDFMTFSGRLNVDPLMKKQTPLSALKDLTYSLHIGEDNIQALTQLVSRFNPKLKLPDLSAQAINIQGKYDAEYQEQEFDSQIELLNVQADSIYAEKMYVQISADTDLKHKPYPLKNANLSGSIYKAGTPSMLINQMDFNSQLKGSEITNTIQIQVNDSLSVHSHLTYDIDQPYQINFSDFQVISQNFSYQNTSDFSIGFKDKTYSIDHFNLADGLSNIKLDASYQQEEALDISLDIVQFNSEHLQSFVKLPDLKPSSIDLKFAYKGTQNSGEFDLDLNVPHITSDYGTIDTLQILVKQNEDTAFIRAEFAVSKEKIRLQGKLPLNSSLEAITKKNILSMDQAFEMSIATDPISLGQFNQVFHQQASIDGILALDLQLYNTLNDIKSKGQINLRDASLQYPEYGTNLNNINSQVRLDQQKIILDSLRLSGGKGFLTAQGQMLYTLGQHFHIDSLGINLISKDLHLLNSNKISSKLDAQLQINQTEGRNLVQGQITFKDSKVNLNKLKKNSQQNLKSPLLLQTPDSDSISITNKQASQTRLNSAIDADMKIVLPRNTWIKDDNFEIEITGNLQIKKSSDVIRIFGEINSRRGSISYYGKKFNIEEAKVIFNDRDYLNPELLINANYRFREGNERRKINLVITGTVKQIQINFLLDGKSIEEKDAISYIVFGRNLEQLSSREQSSLNSGFNASEVFGSIFLNSITGKINDKVKDVLSLDILDINGANPYGNSEIEAGKYFGDRIFISYAREFNLFNNKQVNNERFNIEYQISKRLFLSGTQSNNQSSGIDLYFKWER